jgi:hypothetical protein
MLRVFAIFVEAYTSEAAASIESNTSFMRLMGQRQQK